MEQATESKGYGKRPIWQYLVIYAVIGVIVYGFIYYLVTANKSSYRPATGNGQPTPRQLSSSTPIPAVTNDSTITLNLPGFTPSIITVKAGTTVTWVNKSGEDATVNSDPHPVHTGYPPLNLGIFSDGQTLSLTFDKPGRYGYHNHLDPSEKGTVVVE